LYKSLKLMEAMFIVIWMKVDLTFCSLHSVVYCNIVVTVLHHECAFFLSYLFLCTLQEVTASKYCSKMKMLYLFFIATNQENYSSSK